MFTWGNQIFCRIPEITAYLTPALIFLQLLEKNKDQISSEKAEHEKLIKKLQSVNVDYEGMYTQSHLQIRCFFLPKIDDTPQPLYKHYCWGP